MAKTQRHPLVHRAAGVFALAAVLLATSALAQVPERIDRNYDARLVRQVELKAAGPSALQRAAEETLAREVRNLAVDYDPVSGVAKSVRSHAGYLTGANPGADPETLAIEFVRDHRELFGLTDQDLRHFEVTDVVPSALSGATHVYFRQTHQGIAVYNGQLHVNVNRDGRILSVLNAFVPDLQGKARAAAPGITPVAAAQALAEHLGLEAAPRLVSAAANARRTSRVDAPGLSQDEIRAELFWLPLDGRETGLVWNFQARVPGGQHWFDVNVDALTGEVVTRFDWISSGSYRVYQQPTESPQHTTPLPPSDARVLVVDPEDATASPSGWLASANGVLAGNNVHACGDTNANNACDTPEPTCSGGVCDFTLDLTTAPAGSLSAAITNLFYWNNVIHDVQYQYGFDEAAGNFQEDNFGNGGIGGDSVNADAQDGSGNCNANFATPTDGSNPRMQMFLCANATPSRDGDYDNGVIVHEYGHGISNRQVGGPSNSSCLSNTQQAGEGWSDWHALVYTAEAGDLGTDPRGVGSYLFALPPDGTIRDLRYSTDPAINNWTYESISGASVPHGVGSRWAQVAWEAYWALVDAHGFEGDLLNFDISDPNEAGNKRALYYVNEGLKNTACSPTFVDNRDGIIQAATDSFGGEDVCLLWEVFGAFGLGTDAVSGGSGSTNPTNGFEIPIQCQCQPPPIADAGPDQVICSGDSTVVGTPAQPDNTYLWAPGGETTAQITVSPVVDTTYTVTATTAACGSDSDSATVFVDDGTGAGLDEDYEGDTSGWTATGLWHQVTNSTCASPENGYSSPTDAFYYGQDATCDYATGAANSGTLTSPVIFGLTGSSTLTFDYFRQVESFSGDFDRTRVDVVTDSGRTTVFSLNSSNPSQSAWVSSGAIGLSAFAGQAIRLEFVFETGDGVSNNFVGWLVDDVVVTGSSPCGGGNTAPSVTITSPADGSSFTVGDPVSFAGTATDAEDGDLSAGLSWTSSLDGAIGSGASFVTSALSVGSHTITASVTDSGGLPGSDSITVTIAGVCSPKGAACAQDSDCCSLKCRGKSGSTTCK